MGEPPLPCFLSSLPQAYARQVALKHVEKSSKTISPRARDSAVELWLRETHPTDAGSLVEVVQWNLKLLVGSIVAIGIFLHVLVTRN